MNVRQAIPDLDGLRRLTSCSSIVRDSDALWVRVFLSRVPLAKSELNWLKHSVKNMDKKINSTTNNDHLKVGICSEFLRYSHVI